MGIKLRSLIFFLTGAILALGAYKLSFGNISFPDIFNPPQIISSYSVEIPPKDSLKGTVVSSEGKILFQSRIAISPAELQLPNQIKQGERLVTGKDGMVEVSFGNLGKVIVLPETDIEFIQTLPSNFVFRQEKGKVIYQVAGETRFEIRTLKLITLLPEGILEDAIDAEKNLIIANLKEGEATVSYNDSEYVSHVFSIKQGEKFVFDIAERGGKIE